MISTLLSIAHTPRLRAAYLHGKRRAAYLHVSTSNRECVRVAVAALIAGHRTVNGGRPTPNGNMSRERRADRRALYLGMISALRAERRLMSAFSL